MKLKSKIVGLFAFVLVLFGCSNAVAYTGPVSNRPLLSAATSAASSKTTHGSRRA